MRTVFILLTVLVTVLACEVIYGNYVFGDGFSRSSMVCSHSENYTATMCVGIKPLALKGAKDDNFSIRLELYDENSTSSVFPNATFFVSVTKNQYNSIPKNTQFLSEVFNTRNGRFTININNSQINASQFHKPMLTKSNTTGRTDHVNLTLPLELDSGQYRFQTVAIVNNREPLYFDSDFQVGDIESKNIVMNEKSNNITILSYYDKIMNLKFDPFKRTLTWYMPFEYNASKIDMRKVVIHQEVIIPDLLLNFLHKVNFNMTMNDGYYDSSRFYVDPYSLRNQTIIHYVPNANTLFEMSYNDSQKYHYLMKFVLFL